MSQTGCPCNSLLQLSYKAPVLSHSPIKLHPIKFPFTLQSTITDSITVHMQIPTNNNEECVDQQKWAQEKERNPS